MWSGVDGLYPATVRSQIVAAPTAMYMDLYARVAYPPLDVSDGSVTDDATSNIRRSLSLVLPAKESTYQLFAAPAGEITLTVTARTGGHSQLTIPDGVFVVDADSMGYDNAGTLTLTCPDRWRTVQRNRFGISNRSSIPTNMVWQEIQRLVQGAWPNSAYPFPGWAKLDKSVTTRVGSIVWDDGSRENAILGLANDNGLDIYFDRYGKAVLEPLASLSSSSPAVATIDAGETGVMVGADRTRDRSRTFNAVIASTAAQDITLTPQLAQNTTLGDPFAVTGPFGFVPDYYSSVNIRTTAQATAAAKARLSKTLGLARQLSLSTTRNWVLDSNDVIQVVLPMSDLGTRPTETHIIDSITTPLSPGAQTIQTRATVPAVAGDS